MWKNMNIPDQVLDKNILHYRKSEEKIKNSGNTFAPAWNWSAFFFTFGWLVYRRCYKWAAIAYLASILLSSGLSAITGGVLAPFVPWAICIAMGIFGDSFYFYAIKEKIFKLKENGLDDASIVAKTRPSWVPALIIVAIVVGVTILATVLLFSAFAALFAGMAGIESMMVQ